MNSSATKTVINILNIPLNEHKTAKAEFYPYLAYINPKGNPDGVLFDNFMFDISEGETLADWEANVNLLLDAQSGIPALDSAAEDVKTILNLPQSRVFGIYLKAPVPKISLTPFGDINRDGITEKLLDTEDCLRAFSVFMSDFVRQLSIYNFKNLIIKGWVLEGCEDGGILSAMESYLINLGYKVLSSDTQSFKITSETDFSQMLEHSPKARVFYGETPKFIINCAFSEKIELRTVYDSLYILLNSDKFISDNKQESKAVYTPSDSAVTENISRKPISQAVSTDETVEYVTDELIEELFEDIPKVEPEVVPEVVSKVASEVKPEAAFEVESDAKEDAFDKEVFDDESECITEEISVEISITQPEPELKPKTEAPDEEKREMLPCLNKNQKRALVGAGIAVAAVGLAYIIGKSSKD